MLRVKGERGVVDPEGEEEAEVVVLPKPDWDRTMVMLRLIGTASATVDRTEIPPENELYFRSFPRPVSGAGPASVSSQSL